MERLQREFPDAHFVKAFNQVNNSRMVNPQFDGIRPTMFICGNDTGAKATVTRILDQFGWETEDIGQVEAARAIEPLCMLWAIRYHLRKKWDHAFKLLKEPEQPTSMSNGAAAEAIAPSCRSYAATPTWTFGKSILVWATTLK
jgi:hypothetical protein